jgi:hypothetical protein
MVTSLAIYRIERSAGWRSADCVRTALGKQGQSLDRMRIGNPSGTLYLACGERGARERL